MCRANDAEATAQLAEAEAEAVLARRKIEWEAALTCARLQQEIDALKRQAKVAMKHKGAKAMLKLDSAQIFGQLRSSYMGTLAVEKGGKKVETGGKQGGQAAKKSQPPSQAKGRRNRSNTKTFKGKKGAPGGRR